MSVIGQVLKQATPRAEGLPPPISYTMNLGEYTTPATAARTTDAYLRAYGEIGWLFAVVSRISTSVGETEWHVTLPAAGDTRKPNDNHELKTLLDHPNEFMTGQDLMEYTSAWLDLVGSAFWVMNLKGGNKPADIWPVPPQRMTILRSQERFIIGYHYKYGNFEKDFPPEAVLRFANLDPSDLYGGVGAAQSIGVDLDTELSAALWNRNFFANSARPDAVLESEQFLNENEIERVRQEWSKSHKGVERAHRVAILRSGLKYHQISLTHQEMGFGEQRRLNRDNILGAFGMPASLLGISDTVNRAVAESQEYVYARWVVVPRLKRIQRRINESLARRYGDVLVEYDDPTPENADQEREDARVGLGAGYMTVNEAREEVGLPATLGGDVYLWPANVFPIPAKAVSAGAGALWRHLAVKQEGGSFLPDGYIEPLPQVPDDTTPTDESVGRAIERWNRTMPRYSGLLEAKVVGGE